MTDTPALASTRQILTAAAVALAIAAAVLVVAVLPAEYGIDPLGTGRALGLTTLATAGQEDLASGPNTPVEADVRGVDAKQAGSLEQDTFTVELRPFEGVEYKYRMEQGASLIYTWTTSAPVKYDFHGEPDGAPARYSESYGKGTGASAAGSFLAPKAGIHGWFWENTSAGRVTVTLKTSGFYTASTEYRDGERKQRTFGGQPGGSR
jgi:uncharacterized membrane protein